MTQARQKYTTPRKSKFTSSFQRTELERFLKQLGLQYDANNQSVVNSEQFQFIKDCIREDLGISPSLNLKVRWYETGNAFSTAVDQYGNNIIQIFLGNKNSLFQVGFNKRSCKFLGLYYQKKMVSYELLRVLL